MYLYMQTGRQVEAEQRAAAGDDGLSPVQWEALTAAIDAGCRAKGILYQGKPGYSRLGRAIGYDTAVYNIADPKARDHRPSGPLLVALARFFGESPLKWLQLGGYLRPDESYENLSPLEQDIVAIVRSVSPRAQRNLRRLIKAAASAEQLDEEDDSPSSLSR